MDTTALEEVKNGTSTTTNGNGDSQPTTKAKTKTKAKADTDLFESGTPGEQSEQLAALGLESVARLVPDQGGEAATDVSATEGLIEVSSEALGASTEGQPEEFDESTPLPAYYGSYDTSAREEYDEADEVVIGTDDRIRIFGTQYYPWRAICSLRIRTRTGTTYIGTGWFINARTVMTAGHCVYLHNEGGWAQSITVMPGRNGSSLPYGSSTATSFRSVTGWTGGPNPDYDYGCIILPQNNRLGARTGSFGFAYMGDSSLRSKYVNLSGYPGDKPAGTQWYHHRRVKGVSSRRFTYDIDTAGGQSGSPVWYIRNNVRYAVGIHTYGSLSGNSATRITKPVFNLMKNWKALGS